MAYWRTVLRGNLSTVENWSYSVAYGIVGIAPDTPDQAAADGILANLLANTNATNVGGNVRALLSTGGNIVGWRVEKRAEDESILSVAEGNLGAALVGTGTPSKTPQDALVVSLRTSTPGPRGRGRVYLPALGAALTANFTLNTPTAAGVVGDMKVWLDAIQDQIDNWYISQASALRARLSVRSVTDHLCRDVTSLQVGTILDTQRRRRDLLLETYTSVAYP